MPPAFATAFMVGFIEWACIEAIRPFLLEGEHSVGTHENVSRIAATPAGLVATAEVRLVAVEGRKLVFAVACRDERAAIRTASCNGRVAAKRGV